MKRKTFIKEIVLITLILIITALSTAFFIINSPQYNPKRLLTEYINAVYSNDTETLYKYSVLRNSAFISKEDFMKNALPQRFTEENLADFQIEKVKKETNGIQNFSISYLAEDGSSGTFYMAVENSDSGFFGLHKYLVCPDSNKINSLTVYAPAGATVSLNGTVLEYDIYKTDELISESNFEKFNIKYLLPGSYSIKSESSLCQPCEDKFEIDANGSTNEYYIYQNLSQSVFEKLCGLTENNMNSIFSAAANQNFTDLKKLFSTDFIENKFDHYIEDLSEYFFISSKSYNITDVEIYDIKPQLEYSSVRMSYLTEINIPFTFNYKYTAESPDYNGEKYNSQKADSGILYIQYILENGEWKINTITQQIWF